MSTLYKFTLIVMQNEDHSFEGVVIKKDDFAFDPDCGLDCFPNVKIK